MNKIKTFEIWLVENETYSTPDSINGMGSTSFPIENPVDGLDVGSGDLPYLIPQSPINIKTLTDLPNGKYKGYLRKGVITLIVNKRYNYKFDSIFKKDDFSKKPIEVQVVNNMAYKL